MKRYELKKDSKEYNRKERNVIRKGCVATSEWLDPVTIKSFDSKEEALEALTRYDTEIGESGSITYVTEYWVEEADYDEDGEWIDGGDILDCSNIIITIYNKETMDVIKITDNIKETEDIVKKLEYDGIEIYVAFGEQ